MVNNKKLIHEVLLRLAQRFREPGTELIYGSNFELLIAVILSARTTDAIVNRVTKKLFAIAATPAAILELETTQLELYIKSSGFYRSKARHILATCKILLERFNGIVPGEREYLAMLPGVGRKTANVILNVAFAMPTIAVDTHVFRVAHRLALTARKTPEMVEQDLLKIVPKKFARTAGMLLLLHGRHVCLARKPRCNICALKDICIFHGHA